MKLLDPAADSASVARLRGWICALSVFAVFCVALYGTVTGIRFLFLFLAAAGLGFAVLIATYLPFRSPGLLRAARILRRLAYLVLILFGVTLLSVELTLIRASTGNEKPGADYVLVLGAGVNGETPSYMLHTRIETALRYLEENPSSRAILSGGQGGGERITEAEAMRRALTAAGIAEDRLLLEERSTSTEENVRFSLELLQKEGFSEQDSVAVVTHGFHLFRARRMLAAEGCENTFGVPAPLPPYPFFGLNYYLREYFTVMVLLLGL